MCPYKTKFIDLFKGQIPFSVKGTTIYFDVTWDELPAAAKEFIKATPYKLINNEKLIKV